MREYRFLSTWCIDAPIGRVWDAIEDATRYPEWWPGVLEVTEIAHGDGDGIGRVNRTRWRSALPYELSFDIETVEVERPHLIRLRASGELAGEGIWRLFEGRGTAVVYSWNVRTSRAWMNALRPLAQPAFTWNHDVIMRRGAVGLARLLGAPLLTSD